MDHTTEIFQYLKTQGKSRPSKIIKQSGIAKRAVFKALRVLRNRALIKKEGFRPKIFYSLVAGAELEPAPNPIAPTSKAESKKVSSSADQGSLKKQLRDLESELNRAKIEIKRLAALLEVQEGETARVQKLSKHYQEDNEALRKQIYDLRYNRKK